MTKEQFNEVKELAKEYPVLEEFLAVFKTETVETLSALRKFQRTMNSLINKMKNLDLKEKDFEKIINRGISYTIPLDILHRIRDLDEKIKRKVANQAKQYEVRSFRTHTSKPSNPAHPWKRDNPATDNSSTSSASHKNTQIHFQTSSKGPPKEGRDKIVQQIKLTLNKLSRPNYEKLQKEIMDLLIKLFEPIVQDNEPNTDEPDEESAVVEEEDTELFHKTITDIYYILSKTTDVKMSEVYAELCASFIREHAHPLWKSVLQEQMEQYCLQLQAIETIDPDTDNDAFCLYTKRISDNRGKAVFLLQLSKLDVIPTETVMDILQKKLLGPIHECVFSTIENKKIFVDEWTEHVSLFVNLGKTFLKEKEAEKWDAVTKQIQLLGQVVIKEHPNMTSRSKFKYKDL